ncbi:MAG: MtrB/PioB family outer membrane beta-barrel protein [Vicinamibacterales bacterium]
MDARLLVSILALLLAAAGPAGAQQPPLPSVPLGTFDVGFRAASVDGDAARFQRYRDIRDKGAGVNVSLDREATTWAFSLGARNLGYRDQRVAVEAAANRVQATFAWTQVPLFYGATTATAYAEAAPGVLTLDPAVRLAVQNGAIGIPRTPAQALTGSIYRGLASPFDLDSRRDTGAFTLKYAATPALAVDVAVTSAARTGTQPWGAGMAFSVLPEVALPLDSRTTNVAAGVEWTNRRGMFRVGYEGSYFDNRIEALSWDNPVRATDYASNPWTVTGYDPSGYITGNGAATGRMALAPSNFTNGVSGLGIVKLPYQAAINGAVGYVVMRQDAALIPWTSNAVIASPLVHALYPGLASLDRPTADMDVRLLNANLNYTVRPNRYVGLTAKYRFFNRDDRTAPFDATDYVRMDAAPEDTGAVTAPLDITRNKVDVDVTLSPVRYVSFHAGAGYDVLDHPRVYARIADTTVRVSADTVGNRFVTLRARVEHTRRVGSDLDAGRVASLGLQPEARAFDDADRTRNRGTAVVDVTPVPFIVVNASVFVGRDTYDGDGQQFGLLSNDNTGFTIGAGYIPSPEIAFNAYYGHEKYASLQASRAANPAPDPSWTDASRNWNLDADELVETVGVTLDLIRAFPRTEIRAGYDWNDSNQGFVHSGPRIDALAAIGQFVPLPAVTNRWQRGTLDVRYFVTSRIGIGAGYWYDRYDVTDYQTLSFADGTPRIDYLGSLTLGYGYRPFEAHTGFLRLIYSF